MERNKKIQNKIILGSTIFGGVMGSIAGWYSIPTMIAEWSGIMEYDFIDDYINSDLNPYSSTAKGVSIWGLISTVTIGLVSTISVKTVEYVKLCWENRRQVIEENDTENETNEETSLLSQTQINSINNSSEDNQREVIGSNLQKCIIF
ncbi:hypothetical protein [Spiroplasma endosymbiont of Nebria brevicollis]|uniref:hypothetical protein n=1 Tax=Spiroplasma endosymbiont of Nebria brevicollis TaxID=3066284 RepID=UPI00313BDD7C